jgi:hypothetical protein
VDGFGANNKIASEIGWSQWLCALNGRKPFEEGCDNGVNK